MCTNCGNRNRSIYYGDAYEVKTNDDYKKSLKMHTEKEMDIDLNELRNVMDVPKFIRNKYEQLIWKNRLNEAKELIKDWTVFSKKYDF